MACIAADFSQLALSVSVEKAPICAPEADRPGCAWAVIAHFPLEAGSELMRRRSGVELGGIRLLRQGYRQLVRLKLRPRPVVRVTLAL